MNTVPVRNGKPCIFRVVRVSGTIRKAEEEAIRRARELIVRAKREAETQGDSALDNLLRKPTSISEKGIVDDMDVYGSDSQEEDDSDG